MMIDLPSRMHCLGGGGSGQEAQGLGGWNTRQPGLQLVPLQLQPERGGSALHTMTPSGSPPPPPPPQKTKNGLASSMPHLAQLSIQRLPDGGALLLERRHGARIGGQRPPPQRLCRQVSHAAGAEQLGAGQGRAGKEAWERECGTTRYMPVVLERQLSRASQVPFPKGHPPPWKQTAHACTHPTSYSTSVCSTFGRLRRDASCCARLDLPAGRAARGKGEAARQ